MRRPNLLLIVNDQERHRGWIPDHLHPRLPHRSRLLAEGTEFTRHYTHSSPCSPSRATLLTGQYVPEHGVTDNVFVEPTQPDLHTTTPTVGHLLRDAGYRTAYLGKWHLSYGNPDMEAYGFSDWTGEDWAWTGLAGTGTYYDGRIAAQAAGWLGEHGDRSEPWFLAVGLVNPHDICWYPADQPDYQAIHPERTERYRRFIPAPIPGRPSITPFDGVYDELFTELPASLHDDLRTKPAVQDTWRWEENHSWFGHLDRHDERVWRRALDYYFHLHELNDAHLGTILDALEATGRTDDTVVVFTSDHGEQAGGHGMRGKGPFAYEEIMRIPLYVRGPGATPGATVDALTSSADIPSLLCGLAGVDDAPSLSGHDLRPLLDHSADTVRDHVLFAQAQGWHKSCISQRFALRGYFDGRHKYVRYFGVGGGVDNTGGTIDWQPGMRFGPDSAFEDHEHELYDLVEDPHELVNLAVDPTRQSDVRDRFEHLLSLEAVAFTHPRPPGRGTGSTHVGAMLDEAAGDVSSHA